MTEDAISEWVSKRAKMISDRLGDRARPQIERAREYGLLLAKSPEAFAHETGEPSPPWLWHRVLFAVETVDPSATWRGEKLA